MAVVVPTKLEAGMKLVTSVLLLLCAEPVWAKSTKEVAETAKRVKCIVLIACKLYLSYNATARYFVAE